MSNISVSFLGEEFIIPSELREYIGYMSYAIQLDEELMPLLLNQMKTGKYSGYIEEDFAYFKTPLSKIGDRFIAKLAEVNIFDVTLSELVYKNSGYIMLNNVCKETIKGVADILCRVMESYRDGYINAYKEATSSITGSGFSVWTSDPIDAALFSLMEYSEVKGQVNKAEQQYKARLTALEHFTQNQQDRETKELLANSYYPRVKTALETFSRNIVAFYINKLEQHNLFDTSCVINYDLNRSDELLQNINLVSDKAALLKKAFSYCPYNHALYLLALENGLADVPTFETARYLRQEHILIPAVEKYIKDNYKDGGIIENPVMILAMLKDQPVQVVWESVYSRDFKIFHRYYGYLQNAVDDQDVFANWINDNITVDAVEFCGMTEYDLTSKIGAVLEQKVITENQFLLFKKIGILDNEPDIVKQSSSLQEANSMYAKEFVKASKQLAIEQQKIIDRLSVQVDKARVMYETAQKAYDFKIQAFQEKIQELEQEKSKLGFFARSKKKELQQEILKIQSEMEMFVEANDITALKNEYKSLYYKMHSF